MRNFLYGIITFFLLTGNLSGQQWSVPEDKRSKLSSFPFDENTRKAGEKLYSVNCMSCHGTPGKANFLNLVPPPGDPATEKIQKNNDGEIYYKVTTGRGQMPSFRSVLSSSEIWNIISFLRTFNPTYQQQIRPVITSAAYPGAVLKMFLSYKSADSTIALKVIAVKKQTVVLVTGAEIKILVHRTFGLLPLDEAKTTNNEGLAVFKVPSNLPGDTAGNVLLSVRFTNEDLYGPISLDTMICAGQKTFPVSLVAQRAMWNNVRKAPIWILLVFGFGLLSAWSFIFYVLMKLRDIFVVGMYVSNERSEKDK
jgi:mono/diheme cytochrome c family protein